jgi:hypothetical protein
MIREPASDTNREPLSPRSLPGFRQMVLDVFCRGWLYWLYWRFLMAP